MANISQIKIGETTYNVKDSYAREKSEIVLILPPEYIGGSCDSITENSLYFVSSTNGVTDLIDFPITGRPGWIRTVVADSNIILQEVYPYQPEIIKCVYIRTKMLGGVWSSWMIIPSRKINNTGFENDIINDWCMLTPETSYSSEGLTYVYHGNGKFHISGTSTPLSGRPGATYNIYTNEYNSLPFGFKNGDKLLLHNSSEIVNIEMYGYVNGIYTQTWGQPVSKGSPYYYFTLPQGSTGILIRFSTPANAVVDEDLSIHLFYGSFVDIIKDTANDKSCLTVEYTEPYMSCDDVEENTVRFASTASGTHPGLYDFPLSGPGWLLTLGLSHPSNGNAKLRYQIAYPYNTNESIKYRNSLIDGSFTSWTTIGSGTTTTITQLVSRDTYNNEYNITVEPQITTDSNGWLQPIDTNTSDETGKTDMTSAIMAMLSSTGYCHLAPGIYYVSGNIDMPMDSTIEGCGKKTIIRLLQSTTSGYIFRMHTRSTLKNICLSGGFSPLDISTSDIGGRNGVQYIGNHDGTDPGVLPTKATHCMIEGCWFENLDNGIYGYNSGGGIQEGLNVVACFFTRCKVGINLDYYVEYCKFTNCVIFQCYYGCINNGGNNVFTACSFHGVIGFVIDNSAGNKTNNSHGTVNGCTFNHIDNMNHPETAGNGYAVKILRAQHGYIFANSQFWYGKIYVENSSGIQFSSCELGGYPTIETSGSGTVFFNDCLFNIAPIKNLSSPTNFNNCYTYSGVAVTN